MKDLKLILLSFLALVVVSALFYFTFSFVIGNVNAMAWTEDSRAGLSFLVFAVSTILIAIIWLFKDEIDL